MGSQNHRMFGVGRDLCGSSSPTLLPKQGHLQQVMYILSMAQAALEAAAKPSPDGSVFRCIPCPCSTHSSSCLALDDLAPKPVA